MMAPSRPRITMVTLALLLVLVAGCSAAVQQNAAARQATGTAGAPGMAGTAAPTATLTQQQQTAFGQQLFNFGCVCHPTGQEGAPPVSSLAALPASTIQETVRRGAAPMPMWNEQQLSADWLNLIISSLQAGQQGAMPTQQGAATPTASP